jgi:hypothetical protein
VGRVRWVRGADLGVWAQYRRLRDGFGRDGTPAALKAITERPAAPDTVKE